jgi:hypothetical protein
MVVEGSNLIFEKENWSLKIFAGIFIFFSYLFLFPDDL